MKLIKYSHTHLKTLSSIILFLFFIIPLNLRVSAVSISNTSLYLPTYNSYSLNVRDTKGKVDWSSTNNKVASVTKKGTVRAKRKGTCVISARYHGKKYRCKVKVTRLSYYKKSKRKATYKYRDGSKITLFTGMYRGKGGKARYYAAHIKFKKSSYKKLFLTKANRKRSNGFQSVGDAVRKKKSKAYRAVLAVNGPFNGKDDNHWVKPSKKWYGARHHDYNEIVDGKYYRGNGQCSSGYRYDTASLGLNNYGMGAVLKNLGCTYGYNLDGGSSSTMYFKGKAVTKNWPGGGRPCYDFLCVGR